MQRQAKLRESLGKHLQDTLRILAILKTENEIIGVPNQGAGATTVLGHRLDHPLIPDAVQKRVGDDGRDDGALRAPQFVLPHTTRRLHTGFEHSSAQAKKPPVGTPLRKHGEDYAGYAGRVGRFLPGVGRLDR